MSGRPVMRRTSVVTDKIEIIGMMVLLAHFPISRQPRWRREIIPNAQQETHFSRETWPSHGHGRLNERIRNRGTRRLRAESETPRLREHARARDGAGRYKVRECVR